MEAPGPRRRREERRRRECCRREDRGAEGAEGSGVCGGGVPDPRAYSTRGDGSGERVVPPPHKIFRFLSSK